MRTIFKMAVLAGLVALITKLVTDLRNGAPATATSPVAPQTQPQTPDWMRRPQPTSAASVTTSSDVTAAAKTTATPDQLTTIKGLGPKSEEQLKAARIMTFRDLAAMTPEQVGEIITSPPPGADFKAWIAEAKRLAR
jgi:predicted flap endonuclease-1-like 5' DNA nuclease